MSILQFMEMGVLECILCSILAITVCFVFSGIGSLFAENKEPILQSVLGMTFVAAIGVLCAEVCAILYKYIIMASVLIGLVITIHRVSKKKLFIMDLAQAALPIILIFLIFFAQLMRFVVSESGIFHYNCHQTYFSGVPLELLQADYFSRIRLMDVFPFEWSKYHFFNGAYIDIPLICFFKKNYISYLLAKSVVIAFYAGAICDMARIKYGNRKAWLLLSFGIGAFFVCANNGMIWSITTNNFSSIFMLILAWLAFEDREYSVASMISLGYAITKSGSIVSGGLLFMYALKKMYDTTMIRNPLSFVTTKYKEALYCTVIGIGVVSMVFIGTDASAESSIIFGSIRNIFTNMYSFDWMCIMPMGGALASSNMYSLKFEYMFIAVLTYAIIKNYKNLYNIVVVNKKISIAVFILNILFLLASYYFIRDIKSIITGFVVWYMFPLLALLSFMKFEMIELYGIYFVSLAINFILFNAGVTVPNYIIIAFIILMLFARDFVNELTINLPEYKSVLYLLSLAGVAYFSLFNYQTLFFLNPADYYHEELVLEYIECLDEPFVYTSEKDADKAKLNALKGNRVHYTVLPDVSDTIMSKISMAMRFLPIGYKDDFVP